MTRQRDELPVEEAALLGYEFLSEEQEAAEHKTAQEKADFRKMFLRHLMGDQLFREWLWEQLVALGAFENAFGASPVGFRIPLATHFQLGRKSAGWDLWEVF